MNKVMIKRTSEKLSKIFCVIILYLLGSRIVIANSPLAVDNTYTNNFATFTGMQLNKVTLFSLGVGPYMLSTMVISIFNTPLLKDVQNFLNNPNNKNKISTIEKFLFVLYVALPVFTIYGNLTAFQKIELAAGAVILRLMADFITKQKIVNGISLILLVSIIFETLSGFNYNLKNVATLFAITFALVMYISSSVKMKVYKTSLLNKNKQEETNLNIGLALTGVSPIFYTSVIMTLLSFTPIENILGDYMSILYVVLIFGFTYSSFNKIVKPDKFAERMAINGYYFKDRKISEFSKLIKNKILICTFISAVVLLILLVLPAVIYSRLNIVLTYSPTAILIAVMIIKELIDNITVSLMSV